MISGVFEKYPKLKIILGHLGEGIPFLLWRIDQSLSRSNSGTPFKDTFRRNFYLTTSGNFSDTALTASITEMGIDRIMFSVDWPFISNKMATDWLNASALSAARQGQGVQRKCQVAAQTLGRDTGKSQTLRIKGDINSVWSESLKRSVRRRCKHERHAARRSHSRSGAAGFASRSR